MRIVINDVAATPDAGGIFSILSDFYNDVLNDPKGHEWIFILAGKFFPESKNVKILVHSDLKKNWIKKFVFEFIDGYKEINKLQPDVFISLQNIVTRKVSASKKFVYVDKPLSFQNEKSFSFFKKDERKLAVHQKVIGPMIKHSIRSSNVKVIVQSEWLKKEIVKQRLASSDEIIVETPVINMSEYGVHNGKNMPTKAKTVNFFYPATPYVYKNHQLIIDAVKIITQKYGFQDFSVEFTIKHSDLVYNGDLPRQIRCVGQLERKKVIQKYSESVLVFPSYIETLGLPLLEAAMQGGLILASDTQFSHELLKNYTDVHYFNFRDSGELASLMIRVMQGKIFSHNNPLRINEQQRKLREDILREI